MAENPFIRGLRDRFAETTKNKNEDGKGNQVIRK
jgi:hypothetical protein